ncbi:hypothetical protein QFZ89_006265 [Paraburkholderia youngii]
MPYRVVAGGIVCGGEGSVHRIDTRTLDRVRVTGYAKGISPCVMDHYSRVAANKAMCRRFALVDFESILPNYFNKLTS